MALARASNPYHSGPLSDHFDGTRFFNPDGSDPKGFGDLLRWQLGGGKAKWPDQVRSPHAPARPEPRVEGAALRITMVGHATLLIQTAGLNILTDPVWSERASPVSFAGPRRVTPPGIGFEDLPKIDLVLLSHNHYDHLDVATLKRLQQAHDPLVITPLGNDAIVRSEVPGMRFATGDWGDVRHAGPLAVHFEPCHHWSARGMNDRSMALWAAFVVEGPAGKLLHVGDTGFDGGRPYRGVREKHGDLRAAILPVGAYEPRWFMKDQHQNPQEAIEGLLLCGARWAVGHHWGTFQLTNEGRDAPPAVLHAALEAKGLGRERFRPLSPGEAWDIPD
ncbi:L-ascorbate metabolism protein UlaG (beta-lactamase superfamily) [Hoeflea marina]|uniref:L-ascorbate metabolism protein UlaG (Beta-lactamase superfamily) n=2 Tax=Hoeflea marina TaxID=274592 RepID=A0A317PET1_9HYPH|nr:L-ascorbate metabolism protein UlaG (beta-lactamase superfamily) [Hoeflea marina]